MKYKLNVVPLSIATWHIGLSFSDVRFISWFMSQQLWWSRCISTSSQHYKIFHLKQTLMNLKTGLIYSVKCSCIYRENLTSLFCATVKLDLEWWGWKCVLVGCYALWCWPCFMCSLANVMDECPVGPWLCHTKPSACCCIHTFVPFHLNPFLFAMRSKLRAQYGIEVYDSTCTPWINHPAHITSSQSPRSLSSPITASIFHSRLKTHLFHKSFPP